MKLRTILFGVFLVVGFGLLFSDSLTSYFSQDDFYHLRQVMNGSLSELPKFFIPNFSPEQTFYRPLSREVYNFVMLRAVGLSAIDFHLMVALLIFVNGGLAAKLFGQLTQKRLVIVFFLLVYLSSSVHNVELYYLSSIQTLLATFFGLLSLLMFMNYQNTGLKGALYLSSLCYLLGLLSHESAIGFIVLIGVIYLQKRAKDRSNLVELLRVLGGFIVAMLLRGAIFLVSFGLPKQEVYQPSLRIMDIVNSLVWLTLWCFNLPEMLSDFVTLTLKVNPNLWRFYGDFVKVMVVALIILVADMGVLAWLYKAELIKSKLFRFSLVGFLVTVLPFVFFPHHKFVYYLSAPLIFFCGMVVVVLAAGWQKKTRGLVIVVLACLGIMTFQTVAINKATYWAAKRAVAAKYLIDVVNERFQRVERGAVFYFVNDPTYPFIANEWGSSSRQAFYILSGSDALQLNYCDPTLKVYFEDFGPKISEPETKQAKVMVARFPY